MNESEYTNEHLEEFTDAVMKKLGDNNLREAVRGAILSVMEKHTAQEIILPEKEYHIILWDVQWDNKEYEEQVFANVTGQMLIDAGYYSEDGTSFESMKHILDAIGKQAGKEITYYDVWDIVGENMNDLYNHEEYDLTK